MRCRVLPIRTGGRALTGEDLQNRDPVEIARQWIGTPFVPRAAVRGVGCDCVGFIRGVLADLSGSTAPIPPWRDDWWRDGRALFGAAHAYLQPLTRAPRPGDVVGVRVRWREAHVAILAPNGCAIHASERAGVCEVSAPRWWSDYFILAAFPGHA